MVTSIIDATGADTNARTYAIGGAHTHASNTNHYYTHADNILRGCAEQYYATERLVEANRRMDALLNQRDNALRTANGVRERLQDTLTNERIFNTDYSERIFNTDYSKRILKEKHDLESKLEVVQKEKEMEKELHTTAIQEEQSEVKRLKDCLEKVMNEKKESESEVGKFHKRLKDCLEKVMDEKKESESEVGKFQKENEDAKEAIKSLTHEKLEIYKGLKREKQEVQSEVK